MASLFQVERSQKMTMMTGAFFQLPDDLPIQREQPTLMESLCCANRFSTELWVVLVPVGKKNMVHQLRLQVVQANEHPCWEELLPMIKRKKKLLAELAAVAHPMSSTIIKSSPFWWVKKPSPVVGLWQPGLPTFVSFFMFPGALEHGFYTLLWLSHTFPSYWECHPPNWRTHSIIFQRGGSTTNQFRYRPKLCSLFRFHRTSHDSIQIPAFLGALVSQCAYSVGKVGKRRIDKKGGFLKCLSPIQIIRPF